MFWEKKNMLGGCFDEQYMDKFVAMDPVASSPCLAATRHGSLVPKSLRNV